MGADGHDVGNNPNSWFAKDVFSSSIQYYPGDYRPVSGSDFFNVLSNDAVSLYNGNISALTTGLYHCDETLLKLFRYDKLNRIKRMRTASRWFWDYGWSSVSDNFSATYTYDWNGNLLSLRRKNENGQLMHDINYWYLDSTKNRLDSITAAGILPSRYQYDALGNLVRDKAEGLTVGWNAMGKVDSICRNGNLLSRFRYSPTGQRQMKMAGGDTIFYIHDATGNVMCVYRLQDDTLKATERYLYGSKRLGMLGHQVWITATKSGFHDLNTIGTRTYELTDHLGNVTATLFDRKELYYDDNDGLVYSKPIVSTYTDYYPFGYPINDRSYDYGGYRYFFNGQEADNEALGEGVSLTADFWQYDTRLGRRWNVDPLFKEYESPYACFAGNPVWFADRFGADTSFDDNIARNNFLESYQWIIDQISSIEIKAAAIRSQAAQKGWNDNKTNRKIDKLHSEYEYNTLLEMRQGFEEIMRDPNIIVTYSTNEDMIEDFTGGHTKHVDDLHVNVYFRRNKLGTLIHESRHAWGVIRKEWSFRGGYDTTDELVAFTWQSVKDPTAVNLFKETVSKIYYRNDLSQMIEMSLSSAINYYYIEVLHKDMTRSAIPIPEPFTQIKNIQTAGSYIRKLLKR